jgi:hypothetical protein
MGVDLIGVRRSYNWHGWHALYDLGVAFGWRPAGTLKPTNPEANGHFAYPADDDRGPRDDYFSNDWQWVTDADAAAWASAIYNALASEANKNAARNILDLTDPEIEEQVRDFADAISQHGFCIG